MTEQLYRVAWENLRTGDKGHGQPISKSAATAVAQKENRKYPTIHHWIEPVFK